MRPIIQQEDGQQWESLRSHQQPQQGATKNPGEVTAKGHGDTASTSGHMGGIIATTEGPKGTDFIHWLGFSIKQEAEIT